MYRIEWDYPLGKWKPLDEDVFGESAYEDMDKAIKEAKQLDTYGGKAQYRVVEDGGKCVYHKASCYEGTFNLVSDDLLRDIQQDLGVPDILWQLAIERWLAKYKVEIED